MTRASVVLALVVAGSCLVDRRSESLACESTSQCPAGRACSPAGFCVTEGDGVLLCDDDAETCEATCTEEAPCGPIQCPSGFECTIECTAPNACPKIDCGTARDCDVRCAETGACGPITCGTGDCNVDCDERDACAVVDCSRACECDVDCDAGGMGCAQPSSCPTGDDCEDNFGGCDSGNIDCQTCP